MARLSANRNWTYQPKQNIFCIWKGGEPADFELRLQYRMTGTNDGNSGIQYRSIERPDVAKWVMQGYQADIDLKQVYTGQVYEERGRQFLALRGQFAYIAKLGRNRRVWWGSVARQLPAEKDLSRTTTGTTSISSRAEIQVDIQLFNGHVMSELIRMNRRVEKCKAKSAFNCIASRMRR